MAELREVNVFVASSLSHTHARQTIANVLEDPDICKYAKANVHTYLHEKNGLYNLRDGVPSQDTINSKAKESNCFILYVGDYLGEQTIKEYENAIKNSSLSYTYIYVIHNPSDRLPLEGKELDQDGTPKGYYSWNYFHDNLLKTKNFYEVQTDENTLEHHIKRIREEILDNPLVPIKPSQIEYPKMLSEGQLRYRTDFDFYYKRYIDARIEAQAVLPVHLLKSAC